VNYELRIKTKAMIQMKRRDFLLAAAGLLLFPADALAKTTVKTERSFA